jgi:hypothetical protein
MSVGPQEVIDWIDDYLARTPQPSNSVARARREMLARIRAQLTAHGFPAQDDTCDFSLVPLFFQEANYDGIAWTDQHADLDHLSTPFDIDFCVANGGLKRQQADDATFRAYVARSMKCVDRWRAANTGHP